MQLGAAGMTGHARSSLAILAYFVSASASLAYYVHTAPDEPHSTFKGLHLAECYAARCVRARVGRTGGQD